MSYNDEDIQFEEVVLASFPVEDGERHGRGMTKAILCRNEMNSHGSSTATPDGELVIRTKVFNASVVTMREIEDSKSGKVIGHELYQEVPVKQKPAQRKQKPAEPVLAATG